MTGVRNFRHFFLTVAHPNTATPSFLLLQSSSPAPPRSHPRSRVRPATIRVLMMIIHG
ncbi:hypothetical protein Hanom_Chr12g01095001 [Helianthus anomalus]